MNKLILAGRLVRDPEVNYTDAGKVWGRIAVAVDRPLKKGQNKEERKTDFFNCVIFGKTAEFVGNYFAKGQRILLEGSVQFSDYTDKNGQKRRSTEVIVSQVEFVADKNSNAGNSNSGDFSGGFDDMGQAVPAELDGMAW